MPAYDLITDEGDQGKSLLSLQELILEWKIDVSVGQARDLEVKSDETRLGLLFQNVPNCFPSHDRDKEFYTMKVRKDFLKPIFLEHLLKEVAVLSI